MDISTVNGKENSKVYIPAFTILGEQIFGVLYVLLVLIFTKCYTILVFYMYI